MSWTDEFLLGPLGYMRPIPSPSHSAGVEANILPFGGSFESSSGKWSTDTFGYKREWKFTWPWIPTIKGQEIVAFFKNPSGQSLRIWDPFVINQLSADVSKGGGESRTANAFTATAGTYTCVTASPTLPFNLVPFINTMIQWVVPSSTAGILMGDDALLKSTPLRDQRPMTYTIYATGQGTVQALIRPYDISGVALSDVLGSAVELDSTWKPVAITYSPAVTHVSTAVGLSIASSGSIRTLSVTALKFSEQADIWSIGELSGPVTIRQLTRKYRPWNYCEIQATIREK